MWIIFYVDLIDQVLLTNNYAKNMEYIRLNIIKKYFTRLTCWYYVYLKVCTLVTCWVNCIIIPDISSKEACPGAGQKDQKGWNHADLLIFHQCTNALCSDLSHFGDVITDIFIIPPDEACGILIKKPHLLTICKIFNNLYSTYMWIFHTVE